MQQSRNFSFPKPYSSHNNYPTPPPPPPPPEQQGDHQTSSHHVDRAPRPQEIIVTPNAQGHSDTAQPPQPQSRPFQSAVPTYLAPYRVDGLGRRLADISRSGSEADSLLDLYSHRRSTVNPMEDSERIGVVGEPYPESEEPENSRWIHRDKLAMIESQEMQQAGFKFPGQERSRSTSNRRREHSRDQYSNGISSFSTDIPHTRQEKRQRLQSPSPERQGTKTEGDPNQYDLRTPEEIAAEPYEENSPQPMHRQPGLRATSSRIPILTSSPLPIPQEHLERNTPLTRKRGASGTWSGGDEDGLVYTKNRSRSQSLGSQGLLDDGELQNGTPTPRSRPVSRGLPPTLPVKTKVSDKAAPIPGGRSTSTTSRALSASQKSRTTSLNHRSSPAQRPITRSGPDGRPPSAINRPEGDPPWLATMYKPDPRLPPDQQMLPTHAKRLQQEQWEKEGKFGTASDREFTPLAVPTHNGLQPPSPAGEVFPNGDDDLAWPLRPVPKSPSMNSRPGTSGTEHGGYSTIPRVQGMPGTASLSKAPSPIPPQQLMQMQEAPKEKAVKEKGCGCCVVM